MNFNVISALQNLTNIFGAQRNGKSYFAHPARATTSTRYFPCLECLWEAAEMTPPLRAVPAAVVAARHRLAPDADNTIFCDFGFLISDLGFKIVNRTSYIVHRKSNFV